MGERIPHYLLFSESRRQRLPGGRSGGRWRFVLEAVDGSDKLVATDDEPEAEGNRLDLLAVVRGLEALNQPSRVTLVTPSRYVTRGLRYGLPEWRRSGWRWERFGEMAPVKNEDLWRRVDRALQYHRVECRMLRVDPPQDDLARPSPLGPRRLRRAATGCEPPGQRKGGVWRRLLRLCRRTPEARRVAWAAAG